MKTGTSFSFTLGLVGGGVFSRALRAPTSGSLEAVGSDCAPARVAGAAWLGVAVPARAHAPSRSSEAMHTLAFLGELIIISRGA
jgi:hypothetical protein